MAAAISASLASRSLEPQRPSPRTGSGAYSVDAAGNVVMDSPLQQRRAVGKCQVQPGSAHRVEHRVHRQHFRPVRGHSCATFGTATGLSGSYWTATLEFPGGNSANARNTLFSLTAAASGTLASLNVTGHAANLNSGAPATQQVNGATSVTNGDGSGTLSFGARPPPRSSSAAPAISTSRPTGT